MIHSDYSVQSMSFTVKLFPKSILLWPKSLDMASHEMSRFSIGICSHPVLFVALTAALILSDKRSAKLFRETENFDELLQPARLSRLLRLKSLHWRWASMGITFWIGTLIWSFTFNYVKLSWCIEKLFKVHNDCNKYFFFGVFNLTLLLWNF